MRLTTAEQRDELLRTIKSEALHLEMRDVYAVHDEAVRLARFLETGHRDHEAEEPERRSWARLIGDATRAGQTVRRARIVSEPVTEYIRYVWAGSDYNVRAGEDIRWLPRRLASGVALPGNDYWLFDNASVVFTVFTGPGEVAERQMTTEPDVVRLCKAAFEAVWSMATPHAEYSPR